VDIVIRWSAGLVVIGLVVGGGDSNLWRVFLAGAFSIDDGLLN
jgi:hypothetical protein